MKDKTQVNPIDANESMSSAQQRFRFGACAQYVEAASEETTATIRSMSVCVSSAATKVPR